MSESSQNVRSLEKYEDFMIALYECGVIQFGKFTLASGGPSPIYLDLRRIAGEPDLFKATVGFYMEIVNSLPYQRIAGIPLAGLPVATALAWELNQPLLYPRKEAKEHGTGQLVECGYENGDVVVLIDDLISTSVSKLEAIKTLESVGLVVQDLVVLIDRSKNVGKELLKNGYALHYVFTLKELVDTLSRLLNLRHVDWREIYEYMQWE